VQLKTWPPTVPTIIGDLCRRVRVGRGLGGLISAPEMETGAGVILAAMMCLPTRFHTLPPAQEAGPNLKR
jgi:hypothetical protein